MSGDANDVNPEEQTVLTLKDYADFYGLSMDEVSAIEETAHVPFTEACAIVQMLNSTKDGQRSLMKALKITMEKERKKSLNT